MIETSVTPMPFPFPPNVWQYTVVYDDNLYTLGNKMNEFLNDGWEPLGGIAVTCDSEGYRNYYQAVRRLKRNS